MKAFRNPDDPEKLTMKLRPAQTAALLGALQEQSWKRIQAGREPVDYSQNLVRDLKDTTRLTIVCNITTAKFIADVLMDYARDSPAEATALVGNPPIPEMTAQALWRLDAGELALDMAVHCEAARIAHETNFHEKLLLALDVELFDGSTCVIDEWPERG